MLTVTRILTNTPLWVFALLAYLIWQGSQSLRPSTRPIWRMLIVPLVFFLMGLSRLVTARDGGIEPLSRGWWRPSCLPRWRFPFGQNCSPWTERAAP